jgi:cohesin complex subunit SCC1
LPADQAHSVNPASLTLPDVLTQVDLLAPLPDVSLLLGDISAFGRRSTSIALDWGTQSLITDTIDHGRSMSRALFDDDLGLDLGDDYSTVPDIEKGRDLQQSAMFDDTFNGDNSKLDDLGRLDLDIGDAPLYAGQDHLEAGHLDMTDLPGLDLGDEGGAEIMALPARHRDSESPLSDLDDAQERDLEQSFLHNNDISLYEPRPEEESTTEAPKLKRRKIIEMDNTLELRSRQIRLLQTDRSKILRDASWLPRDPVLLALLSMQKSGGFVSNILGDERSYGWAPELREILSVEFVRKSGILKRKRESGVAGRPELEIPHEEPSMVGGALGLDDATMHRGEVEELEDMRALSRDRTAGMSPAVDFDETTMPILHPADGGPISLGTQHAVHILRDVFGPQGESSPGHRQKSSVLLQDLIPENRTSRFDATKMFFEILVLATKDAVKVEQKTDTIGGPIRLRAKRGLWGAWAEEKSGDAETEEAEAGAEMVTAA